MRSRLIVAAMCSATVLTMVVIGDHLIRRDQTAYFQRFHTWAQSNCSPNSAYLRRGVATCFDDNDTVVSQQRMQ